MNIYILGRQPKLALAELEALHGADAVTQVGDDAALVDGTTNFAHLGGSLKAANLVTTLDTTNPQKAFDYCRKLLPKELQYIPEGKLKLGVSLYGLSMPVQKLNANVLTLKKAVKNTGRSVRAVPNQELALSTAQTLHNQLTSPLGMELVFVRHGDKTLVGQVTDVQDIEAYTLRDRGRPKRDPFVGMLPPKLAQIMISLSKAPGVTDSGSQVDSPTLLDPFCGTGVVLQEAALQGYAVYGTDLSPKMIDYTTANLKWLTETHSVDVDASLERGDATSHTWHPPIHTVVCEGYLGRPIGGQNPTSEQLSGIIHECNVIMSGFLKNIHAQLAPGTTLCIAAPAWRVGDSFKHLPVTLELEGLGYRRHLFTHASHDDLLYFREDQSVARELLVLTRE